MASSDKLAGAASPPTSSSGGADVLDLDLTEERSVSTMGVGGREGLRGLGEELVRLDVQLQSKQRRQRGYHCAWLINGGARDIFAGSELDRTLRPYCDPALLESHGEQLLDLFIRLASKEQWKSWLDVSARIAVSMEATDILVRLFAAYEGPLDDTTLTGLLRVVVEGGSAEVLAALIASGAGPKERFMSTADIVPQREGVRGLGEELVRLGMQNRSGRPNGTKYTYPWWRVVGNIVFVADSELHDVLRPYNDAALLESHGEQLLDFVIRLASKQQWKYWLDISVNIAVATKATDVLPRLFAAYEDSVDNMEITRLLNIAALEGSVEILPALIAAGAEPSVPPVEEEGGSWTALHYAAREGHRAFVTKLIEAGAPVDSRNVLGCTALVEAVRKGHKGVVLDLLAAGADVNNVLESHFYGRIGSIEASFGHAGFNPLCIAIRKNNGDMVKILLEAGAQPATRPTDELPLHLAAIRGHLEIMNLLLLAGVGVGLVDPKGQSALHVACAHNEHDAVDLLLRHNSNVALLCNSGKTPMDVVGTQSLELWHQGSVLQRKVYPPTLNSGETSTANTICGMLQSASAWGRRGWLVLMRSRPYAKVAEQPTHKDPDNAALSVGDTHLAHEPSSDTTVGIREVAGVARTLLDGGHARGDWSGAVVWLWQVPDESLFRNTVRFL